MACGCTAPFYGPPLDSLCYGGTYIVFMSLLDSLIRNACDISEICERVTPKLEPDPSYDFIVVGGGAAGAVVAGRLSEVPEWNVLLLEAGIDEPAGSQVPGQTGNFLINPAMDWGYFTEPQENAFLGTEDRRCRWIRSKVLGGCGVTNGMKYTRGTTKDYDRWAALGNTGWDSSSVLEYFKKSENNPQVGTLVRSEIHGVDGPMAVAQFPDRPPLVDGILAAAVELGYSITDDINDGTFTGFTISQSTNLNGTRVSSARAFLRPNRDRPNLHVMLNSTVTRVLLDETANPKRASGVEFISNNITYTVQATKEVIVSGGTINSPQILLLSGIGPKDELDKVGINQIHDLPGVGQNAHNHVAFDFTLTTNQPNINLLDFVTANDYLTHRQGPLSSTGLSQLAARITTQYGDPEGDDPDLQLVFIGFSATCCRVCLVGEFANPDDPDALSSFTIGATAVKPKSRGYIGLHSSNPLDPPLMQPNYLSEEDDVNVLLEGVRIIQKLSNTTVLTQQWGVQLVQEDYGNCNIDFEYDTDEFWKCAIRYSTSGENHQAGSCKMGPSSDPLAVVDPQLQVYGIEGLRVIDASIMPTVVSGNTHATIVMIGEKGADYIKEKCLSEVCQRISPRSQPDAEYDFIVIGGGAAGSVVASRLSEAPHWKVLLIEAGGDEPPGTQVPSMMKNFIGSVIDWDFKTEPQTMACLGYPEQRCVWPRGKVLGGGGVINGMMYMRGVPQDYDNWNALGNEGWSYEEVLPYFKKSEGNQQIGSLVSGDVHSADGPMTVSRFPDHPGLAHAMMEAAQELGYPVVDDLNAAPYTGFTIAQATVRNGSRLSSARAFLRPVRNRTNLHVMLNSTATKILFTKRKSKTRASEVQFIYKNQPFTVKAKREVILCAGAINSPKLLLLSGIGTKSDLDRVGIKQVLELPGVGNNLQNHVSFYVDLEMEFQMAQNDLNWLTAVQYLNARMGPMSSTGMAQVTGRLNTTDSNPNLQFFFAGCLADCSRWGLIDEPPHPRDPLEPETFSIVPVVIRPRSRGVIGLKSQDPLAPPLLEPNYLTEEEDVKTLIEGIRIAQKLAKTHVLRGKYGVRITKGHYCNCTNSHRYDTDDFWECAIRCKTGPENHQVGSCKMGPSSDPLAVVDSKLRVYGIKGLRVIDASIMPVIVSGNTHAPVVMIAEKGADYIKEKWLPK